MGNLMVISTLCIISLILLTKPSQGTRLQPHPLERVKADSQVPVLPKLPRRLKMTEEAAIKGHVSEDLKAQKDHKEDNSGNPVHSVHDPTGQEYTSKKGVDTTHFFTMDYAPWRKRRPIHNKSLPAGP